MPSSDAHLPGSDRLPDSSSPDLVLAIPTTEEQLRTWKATHPSWGAALSLDGYIQRELAQPSSALAREGGLAPWILTDSTAAPGSRPILSSCETLRKPALVMTLGSTTANGQGDIREGCAFGIASVFTLPECRRRGYAKVMLSKLADKLRGTEIGTSGPRAGAGVSTHAFCSILYSDIGKQFYASLGWQPYASNHLEFPASIPDPTTSDPSASVFSGIAVGGTNDSAPVGVTVLSSDDLPALAARDCELIREALSRPRPQQSSSLLGDPSSPRYRLAIVPSLEHLHWHLARQAVVTSQIFGRSPISHGALYTAASGSRVWALWTRGYSGPISDPSKNTLSILRLVIEGDEDAGRDGDGPQPISDADLIRALEGVLGVARREAGLWACGLVEMWNPSERVRALVQTIPSLCARYQVREEHSITSLNWFGIDCPPRDVEWLANEKYAWC